MIKVVVMHEALGCDTGCCGHVVRLNDEDGYDLERLDFDHPYSGDPKEWAINFAREAVEREYGAGHAFDLDWENSRVFTHC